MNAIISAKKNCHKNLATVLDGRAVAFDGFGFKSAEDLTLPLWATEYLVTEVEGVQSPHTLDAKRRDLQSFMSWFADENGHLMIEEWLPRDTQGYLNHLERAGRAPATTNRALAVLRHFARWVLEQEGSPFRFGLPTRKIKELAMDEPTAKKLSRQDLNALFRAADVLVRIEAERKNGRPKRNRAILGALYYTGLRVSELCALKLRQYDGTYLRNLQRKGKSRTKKFYLSSECRRLLDEYLETERREDREHGATEWLFAPYKSNARLTRQTVTNILGHLAEEANKRRRVNKIHIHPHKLRHTFGSEVREKTGSDTETAALLGHGSTKYVGIYTRRTDVEREAVLEQIGQ